MNRRAKIKLTLERIKLAKILVAKQTEYISLARKIGYEPVHAPATLQRFRTQLSEERLALIHLTKSGQRNLTASGIASRFVERKAA